MATLLLFGPARTAAGARTVTLDAADLAGLCDAACRRFGREFQQILETSALWVNGEPVSGNPAIDGADEVAVLPPVSGGA